MQSDILQEFDEEVNAYNPDDPASLVVHASVQKYLGSLNLSKSEKVALLLSILSQDAVANPVVKILTTMGLVETLKALNDHTATAIGKLFGPKAAHDAALALATEAANDLLPDDNSTI